MGNLEFNEDVLEILQDFRVEIDEGLLYLLSIYHDLKSDVFPEGLKNAMSTTGIVQKGCGGKYDWKLPLFKGQEVAFDWVETQYCELFKMQNTDRGGNVKESTSRMKIYFSKNPEVRKEEVLGAVRMYLTGINPSYMSNPHYFIKKGKGADAVHLLEDWIQKYRDGIKVSNGLDLSNTMQ